MQPLEYTAAQRDKVLDDLFAMLPSHNGLVIERLYLSLIHISEPRDVEESRMPSSA